MKGETSPEEIWGNSVIGNGRREVLRQEYVWLFCPKDRKEAARFQHCEQRVDDSRESDQKGSQES